MPATTPPILSGQVADAGPFCRFRVIAIGTTAFFIIVYATSLSMQYVEGDDSRSVIYALLGVNNPYYEPMPYHSMASRLLALLPKQEPLVRHVAIGGSALCAIAFLVLLGRLVWHWGQELGVPQRVIVPFMLATPIIVPEFAFLGLVYEPVFIAMTVILVAHLIARPVFCKSTTGQSGCIWRLVGSAVLFGFGVSFRWDTGFYGSVIVVDCLLAGWRRPERARFTALAIAWGCGAVLASVGALGISGYPPSIIVETLRWARTTIADGPPLSVKVFYGVATITPMSLSLLALGIVAVVRLKSWRILTLLLGGAPAFVILGTVTFWIKGLLPAVPALLLLMLFGANTLRQIYLTKRRLTRRIMITGIVTITIAPWLIGLQWPGRLTSRGPGFELTSSPSPPRKGAPQVVFGSGLGIPTPEGPRSLWGFGHVLVGGDWRRFVSGMNDKWNAVIDLAIDRDIAIHQDVDTGVVLARLHHRGYRLTTARQPITSHGAHRGSHHRFLRHPDSGDRMEILLFSGLQKRLNTEGEITNQFTALGHNEVALVYVFPSRFLTLTENNQAAVLVRGPLTGTWTKINPRVGGPEPRQDK